MSADPVVRSSSEKIITKFVDDLIFSMDPAYSEDGITLLMPPSGKDSSYPSSIPYDSIQNHPQDMVDLVSCLQMHSKCSKRCLRLKHGKLHCRFKFPKPLNPNTKIVYNEDGEPEIITQRNSHIVNNYNEIMLQTWRANCDIQFVVSIHKLQQYAAKYVTKTEPRSKTLLDVLQAIMEKTDTNDIKAVQQLLISSVGTRDYSAQEVCLHLLGLPLFSASREFVYLSLDGSRELADNLSEEQSITKLNLVDLYMDRPDSENSLIVHCYNTLEVIKLTKTRFNQ